MHDGEEDEGAGERQRALPVRARQRRQLGEAAVEGEQRAGLAQREAEPLAHVVGKRAQAEGAMEAELGDQAEQAPGLEVDALEGAHRGAQAGVELERVGGVGEEREALHGLRERLGDGLPHGGRERRGSVPPRRRSRVRLRDAVGFVAREPLGGDGLRGPPGREARAGHAAGQLRRVVPEAPHAARAAQVEAHGRLAVDGALVGVWRDAARRGNGGLERAHAPAARPGEPGGFGLRGGDRDEETEVAPGERPLGEGAGEGRERLEPLRDTGNLLQLTARETQALAREVVEPDEAEALVGPLRKEVTGEAAEHLAAEGFLAREPAEQAVEQAGAEVAVEVAPLLRGGDLEELGRHHVGGHEVGEG